MKDQQKQRGGVCDLTQIAFLIDCLPRCGVVWYCETIQSRVTAAQEEYAREGIDWSYVEFVDNQDCLDVLEGSPAAPSLAVFPQIDEACRLPRATYQARSTTHRSFVVPRYRLLSTLPQTQLCSRRQWGVLLAFMRLKLIMRLLTCAHKA